MKLTIDGTPEEIAEMLQAVVHDKKHSVTISGDHLFQQLGHVKGLEQRSAPLSKS